jgi:glycosyltransferase involved in cell wall biosynthesis
MPKLAVYAIAKNEAHNVPRWMESAREADSVIVTDTGSTDDTVRLLCELGAKVYEHQIDCKTEGFDKARNISLEHTPEDVDLCVCLDLDEPLTKGWRKALEEKWKPEYNLVQYPCVWEWQDEAKTIPDLWQPRSDRIHARKGFRWVNKIHEVCVSVDGPPNILYIDAFHGCHYQVGTRDYLKECTDRMATEPNNPYVWIQRGSEYLRIKDYEMAYHDFIRAHSLLGCEITDFFIRQMKAVNCQSIARCLINMHKPMEDIISWLIRATAELPTRRESWVYLAEGWMEMGDYLSALAAVSRALAITDRSQSPLLEEECWGEYPERIRKECIMRLEAQSYASHHRRMGN